MAASVWMAARRQRGSRAVWLLAPCAVALAALGGWRYLRHAEANDRSAATEQWITPEVREVSASVNATGIVRLKTGAQVRVGAQISGIVRRLNVTVGTKVRAGEVIAEIDSRSVEAKIDQAQVQLAQSHVALLKAGTDYARSQKLFEAGIIPRQQMDDVTAALNEAKAAVTIAESGLAAAKVDLAYVVIRAPIDGTVASVSTQQGETVAASFATPTFVTIIQESALEVVAMVDEADIGSVRPGLSVTFTAETYPDHEFGGKVVRIAPVATIVSGVVNYEVAISIARDVGWLRPDMTTNVNIITARHRAMLVPANCIHRQDRETFVYIRSSANAHAKQIVTTGPRDANEIEVTSGLSQDSKVLMSPEGAGKS